MTVKAVLFDIGGVIVTDGPNVGEVARALGLDTRRETLDRVHAAVWEHRDTYDLDQSDSDYWHCVARAAGAPPPSQHAVSTLTQRDVDRWTRPRADAVRLVQELDDVGLRLGILSNAPAALARGFSAQKWTQTFTAMVFSCDTLVPKPAAGSYHGAAERLGTALDHIVFFDDRPRNVEAADEVGLQGHLWVGADDAREFLSSIGIRLPRSRGKR